MASPSCHTLVGTVSVSYDLTEGRSSALMEAAVPEVGTGGDGHTSSHRASPYLLRRSLMHESASFSL
jgi:hypothetical protein